MLVGLVQLEALESLNSTSEQKVRQFMEMLTKDAAESLKSELLQIRQVFDDVQASADDGQLLGWACPLCCRFTCDCSLQFANVNVELLLARRTGTCEISVMNNYQCTKHSTNSCYKVFAVVKIFNFYCVTVKHTHGLAVDNCLSVCLFVHLSNAWIVTK